MRQCLKFQPLSLIRSYMGEKVAFYFALFHVFVVFSVCKSLSVSIFQKICASKINRAENPTVGFLIFGSCEIIAP